MLDIPSMIGGGIIGRSTAKNRSQKVVIKQQKGLWYWLVVAPIKYMMLLVGGILMVSFAMTVALIAFIPWLIVRVAQHKPLKPDFLNRIKAGKIVK